MLMSNGFLRSICNCKMNKCKEANDDDALKCFSCERILDAEQWGLPEPPAVTMFDIKFD